MAAALTGATGAIVLLGAGTCAGFDSRTLPIDPAIAPQVQQQLEAAGPLHPYEALGIGYSRAWDPIGRIALAYADEDAATALADLPGRTLLARDGLSLATSAPIADSLFTLADARVDGPLLRLAVTPVGDRPQRLFDMAYRRDMLLASCPA